MSERFLIFEIHNTLYGIQLDDVERILNTRDYEIGYSESGESILKMTNDEIPISKLCNKLKTFGRNDRNINAIIFKHKKSKIAFLISGKIDIAHLDKIQKREVNFIHKLADYIEEIGILDKKPVIIIRREAIYTRK